MHGATCFAFLKIMRTAFSDSPTHFDMTSGPLIEMKFASDSVATGFASERCEVRPDEAMADVRELGEKVVAFLLNALDRHAARMDLQDLLAAASVGDTDLNLAVEPTGATQRGVDRFVPVRRADHDDLAPA